MAGLLSLQTQLFRPMICQSDSITVSPVSAIITVQCISEFDEPEKCKTVILPYNRIIRA